MRLVLWCVSLRLGVIRPMPKPMPHTARSSFSSPLSLLDGDSRPLPLMDDGHSCACFLGAQKFLYVGLRFGPRASRNRPSTGLGSWAFRPSVVIVLHLSRFGRRHLFHTRFSKSPRHSVVLVQLDRHSVMFGELPKVPLYSDNTEASKDTRTDKSCTTMQTSQPPR